jgi:orotate phosphoribosyltransferase
LRPFVHELANRISGYGVDAICGPLTGGALLAGMIADRLQLELLFAERRVSERAGPFPVDYRIATALRDRVKGRRVAIVDDAVSAGSAVRASYADLVALEGVPVLIGALLVMGPGAAAFAAEKRIPLEHVADLPTAIWAPAECPMCAVGTPLTDAGAV